MKTIQELKVQFENLDIQLKELQTKLDDFKKIKTTIQCFSEKAKEIESYYHGDWLDDRSELIKHDKDCFRSTGEDEIWNLLVEYREEKIELIKLLVSQL